MKRSSSNNMQNINWVTKRCDSLSFSVYVCCPKSIESFIHHVLWLSLIELIWAKHSVQLGFFFGSFFLQFIKWVAKTKTKKEPYNIFPINSIKYWIDFHIYIPWCAIDSLCALWRCCHSTKKEVTFSAKPRTPQFILILNSKCGRINCCASPNYFFFLLFFPSSCCCIWIYSVEILFSHFIYLFIYSSRNNRVNLKSA